jgi:chitodextrinase
VQQTSRAFQRAIRTGGIRRSVICVREAFGTDYLFRDVPLMDGEITVDRNSDIRRSGWVKIGEKSITDVFFSNHAGPFGMEVEVHTGVVFPNGEEELVQVGVFNIEEFAWEEGDGGWPVVQLYDRAKWIQRSPFVAGHNFSGMMVFDVIQAVTLDIMPELTINFSEDVENVRLPGGTIFDDDRWEVIKTCVQAIGAEAYFDAQGVLQIQPAKDPTATPESAVWEFNVGEGFSEFQDDDSGSQSLVRRPQGVLISAHRTISRQETYNGVVVYGAPPSGTGGQPYALAFDNDPTSPTFYGGPFGRSIKKIENSLLTNQAQCQEAAVAELRNHLGLARSVEFEALGNPALDEGDYILFTFSNGSQETHLLDSYSYPLGPGGFRANTRTNPSRQTASVGVIRGSTSTTFAPKAPGTPVRVGGSDTTVTIRWTPAAAGSSALQEYVIYLNDKPYKTISSSITQYTITGLSPGTTYKIRIKAIDGSGLESPLSGYLSTKTSGTGGGPTPTPPEKQYTKRYTATWSSTYTGGGSRASWHGNDCYQGYVSGGNGNYRSLIGFNDAQIRKDLAGATIVSCKVYLYYDHWWANSGGTAIIGTHRYSGRPGSWANSSVDQDRIRSSGWPKPGGRWVNLGTTIGNGFKSGSARGIAIGPGPTTGTLYYGKCRGVSSGSKTPIIEIVYRK